jgi:pimeloyl-ACP methyl ester carboxylesterase
MSAFENVVRVGHGECDTLVVPGLCGTAQDWAPLAQEIRQGVLVAENAFHRQPGLLKGSQGDTWAQWQEELAEILRTYKGIGTIIAHSRGVIDALKLCVHPEQKLVLVAPPLRTKRQTPALFPQLDAGDNLDLYRLVQTLGPLCPDMTEEEFGVFVRRHAQSYGPLYPQILKKESPEKTHVSTLCREALLTAIAERKRQLLLIAGANDAWHDPDVLAAADGQGELLTTITLDAGHYPHVERPDLVAAAIRSPRGAPAPAEARA